MPNPKIRFGVLAALAVSLVLGAPKVRAQDPKRRPIVAVFAIENKGSPLTEADIVALTDYLATRLGETGDYQLVPRDEIRKRLLGQKQESFKACYDQSCQIEIGRELAAELTVSSSVSKVGSQCIITAALYDLGRAASHKTATSRGSCSTDSLVVAIEEIAGKLGMTAPVKETKSVWWAIFYSGIPGGGMYYLGQWGWGIFYSVTVVGGMVMTIVGGASSDINHDSIWLPIGLAVYLGSYLASFIHAGVAAANWEPPPARPIAAERAAAFTPFGESGARPHPALIIPIWTGSF